MILSIGGKCNFFKYCPFCQINITLSIGCVLCQSVYPSSCIFKNKNVVYIYNIYIYIYIYICIYNIYYIYVYYIIYIYILYIYIYICI